MKNTDQTKGTESTYRPLSLGNSALLVFLGGAMGSLLRLVLSELFPGGPLDTANTIANLTGSLAMGCFAAWLTPRLPSREWLRPLFMVGVIGGFTTFSGTMLAVVHGMGENSLFLAILIFFVNVFGSLFMCALGVWLVSKWLRPGAMDIGAAQGVARVVNQDITPPEGSSQLGTIRIDQDSPESARPSAGHVSSVASASGNGETPAINHASAGPTPAGNLTATSKAGTLAESSPAASSPAALSPAQATERTVTSPSVQAVRARLDAVAAGDYIENPEAHPSRTFIAPESGRRAQRADTKPRTSHETTSAYDPFADEDDA